MNKVYYYSKDSVQIPMIIASKKGLKRDGKNPALLYGYGGYGTNTTPFYDNGFMTFLQNEGVVAIPSIRGGGEMGEEWHKDGKRKNKQNAVDDFIAAAEYLCKENYTSKENLAIMGGSHGGMLVGTAINQKPGMCKVAIADRGIYDMLRYQNFSIGYASRYEFGLSKDSLDFKALYKYSPVHNVRDTAYPAVLIITADHDDRALPLHSYKYAASLQKNTTSNSPVLLVVEKRAGHRSGSSETETMIYDFIYDQVKIKKSKLHNNY
jgi:prolyl oligopeptidase